MGALLASLVGPMAQQIGQSADLLKMFSSIFPDFDLASAGGFLQLYVELFYIAAGFAAATLVAKWASDETDGRLDSVLATPLGRARWVIAGGIAAIFGIVVMSILFAAGIGLGAASGGVAAGDAMLGSTALGLFAVAMVGVGVAVGGLWRTSLAAEVTAIVVILTYLIDLLAPALKLPDWVHQLALTAHLGQPMTGVWDPVGHRRVRRDRGRWHRVGRVGDAPSRRGSLIAPRRAPTLASRSSHRGVEDEQRYRYEQHEEHELPGLGQIHRPSPPGASDRTHGGSGVTGAGL